MSEKENNEIVGVIYPLTQDHIERFFRGKTVFVKFLSRGIVPPGLRRGSKLLFYMTGGSKEVLGEARIMDIASATSQDVLENYRDRLFLTATELEDYVGERRHKPMLVLTISDVKRYRPPRILSKYITMAGQNVTKQWYENLMKNAT
ncbi:MAG: DUF365 domain-containing protein [Candidatus Bathyarchaeia archaeon]|jgi:hypothetical protein